jgi:hypothetical protein
MSTITYDTAPTARAGTPVAAPAVKRKGLFARILARMIAARQRQAMEEVRRYALLLPHELEQAGRKINERSEDSLPFQR